MPVPMNHDAAVRLCGRPVNEGTAIGVRQMLVGRFGRIQKARVGTWVDRERAYLVAEGSKAGDGRADLWRVHLNKGRRPFTDAVRLTSSLPAVVAQGYVQVMNDLYVGWLEGGCELRKRLSKAMQESVGVLEAGGVYSRTFG